MTHYGLDPKGKHPRYGTRWSELEPWEQAKLIDGAHRWDKGYRFEKNHRVTLLVGQAVALVVGLAIAALVVLVALVALGFNLSWLPWVA